MPFSSLPAGCPPEDAIPCVGPIYRLVDSAPPTEADFVSYFDEYPGKDWGEDDCQARGLSVYLTYGDAERIRRRIGRFRGKKIAVATLQPAVGLIKKTGNDHHTWWPEDGVTIPPLFSEAGTQ